MTVTTQAKKFELVNGLGTISFTPELISSMIKKVLSSYLGYEYVDHTIEPIQNNYYEVSVKIKALTYELNYKEIDRMQKELLLVMKQSLSLTCVVVLNIKHGSR